MFDDEDTRAVARANRLVERDSSGGFDAQVLIKALEGLAEGNQPAGLVYGAGFESRPELIEALVQRWPVFGNRAETVRRAKDPIQLAALCAALGISHPEISFEIPQDPANWLVKAVGGSGGCHVVPAETWSGGAWSGGENCYFQRIAPGCPVSILVLANGETAQMVGASRQWPQPAPLEPFRFGGALRPADLSPALEERLEEIGADLARACGLRGLNSIDFLIAGERPTLIEINPRPGSTLDIFETEKGSLFEAHLEACLGRLPPCPLRFEGAAAAAIVYAPCAIGSMPQLDWPQWAADRQKAGTALRKDDPLCTVKASARDALRARELMDERIAFIHDTLEEHLGKEAA